MEGNVGCPKAMLILLLCHPHVHPLCSNAPLTECLAWLGFVGASGLVVSPLDLIPDVIPVIGWADDTGYVLLALACAYLGWKQRQRRRTTDPVIDMEPTSRFSKEHTHCWQIKDAAQHGRPS